MTRAPRVLVNGVVLGQPMGGVRRRASELLPRAARLLAQRGGALEVLEGARAIAFPLPAEVRRHASRVPFQPPWRRAFHEGRALRACLARAASEGRPFDLVHTGHLPVPRVGVPFTITLHDLRSLDPRLASTLRRGAARGLLARVVERTACVVLVSETVRAELLARFPRTRTAVVPNAADHFEPLPRRAGDVGLLHVGHLEPRKNLALLLEALALDPKLPPLTLAGRAKGDEETHLRARARELGVESRVRFLGEVTDEELPRLYAEARCAVFPSVLEGFGIGALEARRAGVPLAVADAPVFREVLGDQVATFPTSDPQAGVACARAIRRALERGAPRAGGSRDEERTWQRGAELLVEVWTRSASGPAPT